MIDGIIMSPKSHYWLLLNLLAVQYLNMVRLKLFSKSYNLWQIIITSSNCYGSIINHNEFLWKSVKQQFIILYVFLL